MSDPVRIRDVPHGIRFGESHSGDLSGVSKEVLKECAFRSKNAYYRAKTSQIEAPESLYEEVYDSCSEELKRRAGQINRFNNGCNENGI